MQVYSPHGEGRGTRGHHCVSAANAPLAKTRPENEMGPETRKCPQPQWEDSVKLIRKGGWIQKGVKRGAWAAQLVEHPTLAQVTLSQFGSSSPTSGSELIAQSLEAALDFVCVCVCLSLSLSLSLSAPSLLALCLLFLKHK